MTDNLGGNRRQMNLRALFDVQSPLLPQSPYARAILALVYLGFATGLYAIAAIFIHGPELLKATDYIPWGINISTYIFFVLTSSGLCFVASLGHVFRLEGYEAIGKRAVYLAIVTMLAGFVALVPDLGRPERMIFYLLTPNFSSLMWWMGALYGLELAFIVVEFLLLHKGALRGAKIMGVGALLSALCAVTTVGGIFGVVMARPFYFGAFTPLYFLLTAFLSGLAAISLASIVTSWAMGRELDPMVSGTISHLAKLLTLVLGITLIFTAWKMLVGLYAPADEYRSTFTQVTGNWMWQAEVLGGLVLPFLLVVLAIYTKARAVPITLIASSLVLAGLFVGRLDIVIAGQALPLKALRAPELSVYIPSAAEALNIVGAIAFCGLLYGFGERFLQLAHRDVSPEEQEAADAVPYYLPRAAGAQVMPASRQARADD